jgi:hypothetical protein
VYLLFESTTPLQEAGKFVSRKPSKGFQVRDSNSKTLTVLPAAKKNGRGSFLWCGEWKQIDTLKEHLFLFGAIRSGKSVLLNIAMKGILQAIKPGSKVRLIIFDTKGETRSILKGMSFTNFKFINLCDLLSYAWDISVDIGRNYILATALGYAYFPEGKDSDQFWQNAARSIFIGIIYSFIYLGRDYHLGDICNALNADQTVLIKLLEQCPYNQGVINTYLKGDAAETLAGIKSNLQNTLEKIQFAAAHSQKVARDKKVSLRKFLKSEEVLVIEFDQQAPEISTTELQAIFGFLAALVAASPDSKEERTFVLVDEFRMLGRIRAIVSFVVFCPSKGARLIGSTQSIAGLWDVWGKEIAEELLENFTVGFLKLKGTETAKWASEHFGKIHIKRKSFNVGQQKEASVSRGLQEAIEPKIVDSEFTSIQETSPDNGLTGIFRTESGEVVKRTFSWDFILKNLPQEAPNDGIKRREGDDQMLVPWSETEQEYFMTGRKVIEEDFTENSLVYKLIDNEIKDYLWEVSKELAQNFIDDLNSNDES